MKKIIEVKYINNYCLQIKFADGFSGIIDIKPYIGGGISDELNNIEYFKQVSINEFHGIMWPNGYDFCPNYLWELMKGSSTSSY